MDVGCDVMSLAEEEGRGLGWYPGADGEDGDGAAVASVSTAIGSGNKGYQLLQKMGWAAGKGLGRNEDGALSPWCPGTHARLIGRGC
jgi:hypothetical protein